MRLTVVRIATYLVAEAALSTSTRADLDAYFMAAKRLLSAASASVADSSLYDRHIRPLCQTALKMYLDAIGGACERESYANIHLVRALKLLQEVSQIVNG